jgi:hypothetical protein
VIRGYFDDAKEHYKNAISLAQETAKAWSESEKAHVEMIQNSGEQIRRWGMNLKNTWSKRAQGWQAELEQLIHKIKEEERNQKRALLLHRAVDAKARREAVLDQGRLADQEEMNEIGETYDAMARKLEVIENHLKKAAEACNRYDDIAVSSFEQKVAILEERITALDPYLQWPFQRRSATREKK